MSDKCCDACTHYHWYYDFCDKWQCEIDARSVHGCFEERMESEKPQESEDKG